MNQYFLIRPSVATFTPGSSPTGCSGSDYPPMQPGESLEVASPTDIEGVPAQGGVIRWCFSGLSDPGGGVFSAFPVGIVGSLVPDQSRILAATLTVIASFGKVDSDGTKSVLGLVPGLPPSNTPSTYNSQYDANFDGLGQGFGGLVAAGPEAGFVIATVDLVARGVNIQACDYLRLVVSFAVLGTTTSAFMTWAGNQMAILDCYLMLTVRAPGGLSFSSTHGSGGGELGTTNSLSI